MLQRFAMRSHLGARFSVRVGSRKVTDQEALVSRSCSRSIDGGRAGLSVVVVLALLGARVAGGAVVPDPNLRSFPDGRVKSVFPDEPGLLGDPDDPRIAVAVIAEHGGGGSATAAPLARKVMDAYLLDKYDDTVTAGIEPARDVRPNGSE